MPTTPNSNQSAAREQNATGGERAQSDDLRQRIAIDTACRMTARGGYKGDLTRKINAAKAKLANRKHRNAIQHS